MASIAGTETTSGSTSPGPTMGTFSGQYARQAGRATRRDLDPSGPGERANRNDGVAHDPSFLSDGPG